MRSSGRTPRLPSRLPRCFIRCTLRNDESPICCDFGTNQVCIEKNRRGTSRGCQVRPVCLPPFMTVLLPSYKQDVAAVGAAETP